MFNNLRQLEYKRSAEEALGFYLIYTLLLLVALFAMGPFLAMNGMLGRTPEQIRILGGVLGCAIGILYCGALGVRIVLAKNMMTWHSWVLVLMGMVAAIVHGVIGMIVVAYMTTRPQGWLMPEVAARGSRRAAPGQGMNADPSAEPQEEESEIVRQYEDVMSKVGRKTSSRRRPDLMADDGNMLDSPDDTKK